MRRNLYHILLTVTSLANAIPTPSNILGHVTNAVIAPKVFIISMFGPEGTVWFDNAKTPGSIGNLLAMNIAVPGFAPAYPQAHCLASGEVCQLTTGESEINAAATMTALTLSPLFDLRTTYFLIAGIAGISPKQGTLGDVAFSRYAVQVALQYEFDAREMPAGFGTGYVPQGSLRPDQYPLLIYGTEVFELNENLRNVAVGFAQSAKLNDSSEGILYRAKYASSTVFRAATRKPAILRCDTATADVFYSGTLLSEAFENTTRLFTNDSATYCMSAQEDNATLEALLRAAMRASVDFSRIIIMRTASDFDRPPPGISSADNLFLTPPEAFLASIANIYLAGNSVVKGILAGWERRFKAGVKPNNYIGDIFGSLGGKPNYGPYQESNRKAGIATAAGTFGRKTRRGLINS